MSVELIAEGYLIKGTRSIEKAKLELSPMHRLNVQSWVGGRYRKVPGQWSSYNLYEGEGPGSFEAVIAYLDRRSQ